MNYRLGIDIGGTKIACGLFSEQDELLKKTVEPSSDSLEAEVFFGNAADRIAREAELLREGERILSIGIGIPGYVDSETGQLSTVASLPRLSSFPAGDYLKKKLAGSPENIDARCISQAYDLGDAMAIRAVDQMVQYLAVWIYNVYVLMNIDCIVFSGGLLNMGEKLIGRVKERFTTSHTNGFPVTFRESGRDGDSCLFGAMELGKDG